MKDERIKQIMTTLGYPNSQSLYLTICQIVNETEQEVRYQIAKDICWNLKEKVFEDVAL